MSRPVPFGGGQLDAIHDRPVLQGKQQAAGGEEVDSDLGGHRHGLAMRVGGEAEDDGDGSGGAEVKDAAAESSPPSRRAPLKTILANFLNHVATLEAQQRDEEGENTYEKEFQELKSFSDHLRTQQDFGCGQGELEVNRKKNRYKDILPFDASRVVLSEYPGVPGSDYINANHIKGASGSNAYIAAQGPLPHTVNDFWRMVVETEVQVIVMACNETEAGKHKCERYWNEPEEDGDEADEKQFGKYFVKTLKMREICPDFLVRTMRLRWTPDEDDKKKGSGGGGGQEEERTVCQFHYSAWPDHGIPLQVKPLLEMVRLIRDCQASETLPVLVHCSAGCGRTGTICAIDFIWGLLRTGKLTGDFSLFELVRDMRRQRIAMVQTVDQYILVHRAVRELFLEQMRVIDSHPYENVDDDGNPLCKAADEVTPEYETIFVKGNEERKEKSPADFDRILSARMSQSQQQQQPRRTVMGTAMLSRDGRSPLHKTSSNDSSSSGGEQQQQHPTPPPPIPPPKLRNNIDSAAIDTRKVEVTNEDAVDLAPIEDLTRPKDPVLFEPTRPADTTRDASAAQRFKKGNLRLMKTDNGSWKLHELEEAIAKIPEKKSEGVKAAKKKKKSKDGSGGQGDEKGGGLMRRPSIKRIKAFFSKESKEGSAGPSSAKSSPPDEEEYGSTDAESPASDSELAAALSKMPKLEMGDHDPLTTSSSGPSSLSVPNSLDRRAGRNPDYANLEIHRSGDMGGVGAADSKFWSLSSKGKGGGQDQQTTSTPSLKSSHSSDRLPLADHHQGARPALPIKRSKSMKIDSRSITLSDQKEELAMAMSLYQVPPRPKRSSTETFENFQSLPSSNQAKERTPPPPTKPRRSNNSHPEWADSSPKNETVPDAPPRKHSSDYANVRVKTRPSPPEKSFLEQQLIKLHERITSSAAIPSELKRTLPLIARSSDSLDEDAKRMLKDCQEYLRSSLEVADASSKERVLLPHHRSAESSPMTTLQKSNSRGHLFSSHSSPSNSYNKYGSGRTPPGSGGHQKSPTEQKGICAPPGRPQDAHVHLKQPSPPFHKGSDRRISPARASANSYSHYENVSMTQRKVSESSAMKGKQRPPTRERRNSFREAVENRGKENSGGEDDDGDADFDEESGAPKKSYESIWFGKEQLTSADYHTYENSPLRQQHPQPAPNFRPQRTSASSLGRQAVLHSSVPGYERKSPTPTSGESGGYEPVNFRKLSVESARGRQLYQAAAAANNSQLQSVGLVSEVIHRQQQQQQQQEQSRLSDMSPSSPVRSPPLLAAKTSPMRSPPSSHSSPQQQQQQQHPPPAMPQPPPYKSPPNPSRMMAMSRTSPTAAKASSGAAVAAPQQRQKVSPKRVVQQFPSSSSSPPNSHLQQRDLQHQNYVNVQVARRHSRDTGRSTKQAA